MQLGQFFMQKKLASLIQQEHLEDNYESGYSR